MVVIVDGEKADRALIRIRALGHSAWIIGEIAQGAGQTTLV
jgi:phosphoribosylaminoimidazole (AIR) synthetase